jgi:hypothetical protein
MNNSGDCGSEMSRPVDMIITPKTPLHKETISTRPLQEKKRGQEEIQPIPSSKVYFGHVYIFK